MPCQETNAKYQAMQQLHLGKFPVAGYFFRVCLKKTSGIA